MDAGVKASRATVGEFRFNLLMTKRLTSPSVKTTGSKEREGFFGGPREREIEDTVNFREVSDSWPGNNKASTR